MYHNLKQKHKNFCGIIKIPKKFAKHNIWETEKTLNKSSENLGRTCQLLWWLQLNTAHDQQRPLIDGGSQEENGNKAKGDTKCHAFYQLQRRLKIAYAVFQVTGKKSLKKICKNVIDKDKKKNQHQLKCILNANVLE